jgi:hypothetical protein
MPTNMQQIKLSIPEPCHENWQAMTPTQQGRFCNACAKQVIDFSAMSDAEVLHYFSNIQNKKVCGRAYPDQLDRTIAMPSYPKKKLFWYWNYITLFFLFFSKSNHAKAQGGIKVIEAQKLNDNKAANITAALQGRLGGIAASTTNAIKGKVIDEDGLAVAGATVLVKDTKQATVSDADGFYKLNANTKINVLEITAVGFEKQEIVLGNKNTGDLILTKLEKSRLGEVVIVGGLIAVDEDYSRAESPRHMVVLEVIDNATLQPVDKAVMTIKKENSYNSSTVYTDKKGIYKLRKINDYDTYSLSIEATGYKTEAIKIKGSDLDERKMVKRIFLEKEPALTDYKQMDSVVINSYAVIGKLKRCNTTSETVATMGAMIPGITITTTFADSLKLMAAKITGSAKVFPNPVQRGEIFKLSLKLKDAGTYKIQITDAAGRIVLIRPINAVAKTHIEQVATNATWSSGIYYLNVLNDKNRSINAVSFSIR